MPPKRSQKRQKSPGHEGKVLLAIKALKNESASSQRQAAAIYTTPRTTLRDRLKGVSYRDTRNGRHKLTQEEEEDSLTRWILDMDSCGAAPRPATV